MKKEIIGIFVCMLVIISLFSNVYAIEIGKMDDGWDIKQVDQSYGTGKYNSIAIDANGYQHISYYDDLYDNLKYVVKIFREN